MARGSLAACVLWLAAGHHAVAKSSHGFSGNGTSLLGLKLAATGSTWWYETLISVEGVHLKEELFTKHSHEPPAHRTAAMIKNLACPKGVVCGFTINPKNNPGVDWAGVGAAAGCVVKWDRTNIVKTVVSAVRKRAQGVCDGANNVKSKKKAACGNESHAFDVADVEELLALEAHYALEFAADVAAARALARCYVEMTYEDLQRDEAGELERLFIGALGRPRVTRAAHYKPQVVKKTSDDVRDVMTNFDEIAAYLAALGVEDRCPLARICVKNNAELGRPTIYLWSPISRSIRGL